MRWIGLIVVQTIVLICFLSVALALGINKWGVLFLVGGVFFVLRSLKHPDYYLRRAMTSCLMLGVAHLSLGQLISVPLDGFGTETWQKLLATLVNGLTPLDPRIGFGLIGFAISFAVLDLIRIRLENGTVYSIEIKALGGNQTFHPDIDCSQISVDFMLLNTSESKIFVSDPTLSCLSSWPRNCTVSLFDMAHNVEMPCNPKSPLELSPGNQLLLRLRTSLKTRRNHRLSVLSRNLPNWLYGFLFSWCRVTINVTGAISQKNTLSARIQIDFES